MKKMIILSVLSFLILAEASFAGETLSVIHSRKSVRHFTGEKATKEELETLVKAGMAAPTAMDKRPWAFIIITDEGMLKKLEAGLPYTKMLVNAGSCIVVCGDLDKTLPGEAEGFWVQDCSAAAENILLAAEDMGLGAVWTAGYPIQERIDFLRKMLGLPENIVPLCVIPVGYPTGVDKPKDKYNSSIIHHNKW